LKEEASRIGFDNYLISENESYKPLFSDCSFTALKSGDAFKLTMELI
jgi:hypothetical protein